MGAGIDAAASVLFEAGGFVITAIGGGSFHPGPLEVGGTDVLIPPDLLPVPPTAMPGADGGAAAVCCE